MTFSVGDVVRFDSCSADQIRWGSNDDPNGILEQNQLYVVDYVEVHSQHTKISLDGIKGKFNSVCFSLVEESHAASV